MRALALILLSLVCGGAARAQSAPIGRLFFSPEERAQLDAQRANGGAPPQPVQAAPPAPPPPPVTMNGVVKRSSGKSTVWLNDTPQNDDNNQLATPAADPSVTLRLSSGRKVVLKPGQTLDLGTQAVHDVHAP